MCIPFKSFLLWQWQCQQQKRHHQHQNKKTNDQTNKTKKTSSTSSKLVHFQNHNCSNWQGERPGVVAFVLDVRAQSNPSIHLVVLMLLIIFANSSSCICCPFIFLRFRINMKVKLALLFIIIIIIIRSSDELICLILIRQRGASHKLCYLPSMKNGQRTKELQTTSGLLLNMTYKQ